MSLEMIVNHEQRMIMDDKKSGAFHGRRLVLLSTYVGFAVMFGVLADLVSPAFVGGTVFSAFIGLFSVIAITDRYLINTEERVVAKFAGIVFGCGFILAYLSSVLNLTICSWLFYLITAGSAFTLLITLCIMFITWAKDGD